MTEGREALSPTNLGLPVLQHLLPLNLVCTYHQGLCQPVPRSKGGHQYAALSGSDPEPCQWPRAMGLWVLKANQWWSVVEVVAAAPVVVRGVGVGRVLVVAPVVLVAVVVVVVVVVVVRLVVLVVGQQ